MRSKAIRRPSRTRVHRQFPSWSFFIVFAIVIAAIGLFHYFPLSSVHADGAAQTLPFSQDWSNTGLITLDDDWSGVPGIIGYRGDDLTPATGTDPQTILADGTNTPVDVNANQTAPNTFATGGVAEFHIANPVVALNGSGTADAPFILINLNTIGFSSVNVAYNLRDIDGSIDNAVQPVALHFRVGSSGSFTNVPAGFVADATSGPSLATLVTPVNVTLPAAADNQPLVQIRIMTTNAVGNDEWVGIDDIQITGSVTPTPTPTATPTPTPTPSPSPVAENVIINEIDSDTPGADVAEFVELYDGGVGNTSLTGLVVVFYNGANDLSYASFDLDGRTTDANGYFTLGNAAVPGVDLVFGNGLLQNGADAVALYAGDASSFPNNTPVTTANLRDAIVYDTADADDTGLLVLLNAGQPQVDEDANGNAANESVGRCPNGDGGSRNTSTYIARVPTPDTANNCPPPPVAAAIHDIQGSGDVSPFVGQSVITSGIVTARKSNGFFLQEPDASVDLNPATSEGIFVFSPGVVAVGDAATVIGPVSEFFNLTQISSSVSNVTITSNGNALPAPIVLTTSILNPNGPVNQLERFEGMRMHADNLVSVAPSNEFGETFTVLQGVARPLREPGIEISLEVPPDPTSGVPDCCIPRWDENPERIMIDSDGLAGSTPLSVTSNVTLSNITGPLDFTFGDYKVLPETPPSATANMSAVPVPTPAADELTIAGYNIENFNNNATQRHKAALAIRDVLRLPDIIGTVEIFDLADLQALATEIQSISGVTYEARLIEADGTSEDSDQDVGFLVKTSRVQIDSVTQIELPGCDGTAANCNTFIDPNSGQPALLNDRPPLVLRATVTPGALNPLPIIVVVNHLRSFIDIETITGEGPRVRAKRKAQGEFLANLLQELQTNNPTKPVLSIGDYNAYQFNDGYTDPIATAKGMPTADDQLVVDESPDLVNPNFINLTDGLPADQRYSFIFAGTPQAIDHFLVNANANSLLRRYTIARNNSDFPEVPASAFAGDVNRPERNSDHDMPIGYFRIPKAATTTTVSNVTATYSPANQSVMLTANVSTAAGTINEGSVTFTVTNASNVTIGVPVTGNVSGGTATATYTLPGGTLPQALTITGVFSGGDFTLPSTGTGTLSVTYAICLLYDPTRAVRSGAVYPIKIQLCDINGANVSSAGVTVTAVSVGLVSSAITGDPMDVGDANPDNNFRFDPSLGGTGGYVYNLSTTGLATGAYNLYFTAGNDPLQHSVGFRVR